MPELPEAEFGRKLLETVAVGRRIAKLRCADDPIVYQGVTPVAFQRRMKGRTVVAACRHGKQMWLELDERPWPLFHFGMTGSFRVPGGMPLDLEGMPARPDEAWPPRFTKLHLFLDDGGELVMTNARRLGRIRLRDDPPHEPPISKLGFDPLLGLPTPAAFRKRVARRSGVLKGLLLDQTFAAGVGNWIADEVLYQAKLDPRREVSKLTEDELERLRRKIGSVVRKAVSVGADKERFPRTWLFHHRWGKDADARTARGEKIEHLEVAGRTTAYVPEVQK